MSGRTPRRRARTSARTGAWLAFAALALVAGACGGGDEDAVDVSAVDASELLARTATRIDEARSFRFELEHRNGSTVILQGIEMRSAEGEVAGPNEMSLTVDGQAGPLSVELGIIVLPDGSWFTNPLTGRWERQDVGVDVFFDPAQGVTALMRGIRDARVTGTASVDGVETYVVEAAVDSGDLAQFAPGAPAGTTLTARAWIGIADPLVYRIEIDGAITSAEPANLVRRLTFRDWGAEITISPPR